MTIERPPKATWDRGWQPDPTLQAVMTALAPGSIITIVKRAPDGSEAARYRATVTRTDAPPPWIELVAEWTLPQVVVAGLVFAPGDTLREFFSPEHPYNAFAVISPRGELRGWYGNVTYPAFMEVENGQVNLVWHDLYLDVVILADGQMHLLDDDELAESPIPTANAAFAEAIEQARRDLIDLIPHLRPAPTPSPDPSGSKADAAITHGP